MGSLIGSGYSRPNVSTLSLIHIWMAEYWEKWDIPSEWVQVYIAMCLGVMKWGSSILRSSISNKNQQKERPAAALFAEICLPLVGRHVIIKNN